MPGRSESTAGKFFPVAVIKIIILSLDIPAGRHKAKGQESEATDGMEKLKTETDTPDMGDRVKRAAATALRLPESDLQVDHEHGQWWVTRLATGAQWAVEDAEGGPAVDGFDFEQVSEGEED